MADSSFQLLELVQMSNENGYIIQAVELAPLAMNEWIRFYCIQLSFQWAETVKKVTCIFAQNVTCIYIHILTLSAFEMPQHIS